MYRLIFGLVFILYSAISLAPLEFYQQPLENPTVYMLPIIFGISFLVASAAISLLVPNRVGSLEALQIVNDRTKRVIVLPTAVLMLAFVGFVAYANRNGLVVSSYDARFSNSTTIQLLEYLLLFFVLLHFCARYIDKFRTSLYLLALILVFATGAFTLGYRSPIVLFFASASLSSVIIFRAREGRLPWGRIVPMAVVGIIFLGGLGLFAQYRTETKYESAKFYKGYNLYALPVAVRPFMDPLTMMRADQQTVSKLVYLTGNGRYWGGGLFAANFITLLPGEQPGVRNIIGSLTTSHVSDEGKGWSITPTIQGALYLDGGITGVVIGGALIGMILTYLDRLSRRRPTAAVIAYSTFIAINIVMLVHTGYPDPIFYLVLIGSGIIYGICRLITPSPRRAPAPKPWLERTNADGGEVTSS